MRTLLFTALLMLLAQASLAAPAGRVAGQMVNFPHVMQDGLGTNWDVQPDGTIGDGGNDLYDGGSHLFLDGQQFNPGRPQAEFFADRNELLVGPVSFRGLNVWRRISVDQAKSFIRYAEVFENPTGSAVKIPVRIYFNMGGSVQNVQAVRDERRKHQYAVALGDNNNSLAIAGAGRSSRVVPDFAPQQGNDNVDVKYQVEVPAKQTVVLVHVEARRPSLAECVAFLQQTKDSEYLKSLPRELAGRVINFRSLEQLADLEVLRGEMSDVIEVRGGDLYRGTLKIEKYRLKTSFGTLELPAQRVVGLVNSGTYRPRQLLITRDGEVIGGELETREVPMELSNGQLATVPVKYILRVGYRQQAEEKEPSGEQKPMVVLRTGDRIGIEMMSAPIQISTRYGTVSLPPGVVRSVMFQAEGHGVHQVMLSDGSRFAGLVGAQSFEMKLVWGQQTVKFPASALSRLQLSGKEEEPDDGVGMLSLANEDLLAGGLVGQLKLDTAFSTLGINAAEIKRLSRGKGSVQDVTVELWDQTSVSGQLQEGELTCRLKCGVEMKVPVGLVEEYVQPRPSPSAAAAQQIVKLAEQLGAEDWAARDEAQKKLTQMGVVVIGVLKEIRPKQSAEGQQRIDQIIKELEDVGRPPLVRPPEQPLERILIPMRCFD